MKRQACGSCGHDELYQFLDLGMSPIADAYTATVAETSDVYPLQLAVCVNCKLVQLLEVVDQKVLFGTGYSFYSSASPPLSAYHRDYADSILQSYGELARRSVVEIGCNDGDMLRWFQAAKCPTIGVDPAVGPVDAARSRGLDVRLQEFTTELARELVDSSGSAGVVIANHVLAHVSNVSDVLQGISALLAPNGVAFIEVQYLPDMLLNNAFDLAYHEHRNFFSLTSLANAARVHGLNVSGVTFTQRQGGSLRVTLRKSLPYIHEPASDTVDAERWLNTDLRAYDGMQGRAERIRTRLWDLIWDASIKGSIAGYGAPAKATTLLNYCGVTADWLDFVVDTTPAKLGRFIPGTGIPIKSLRDIAPPKTWLLLAHNYASKILRNELEFVSNGGQFIIPIPTPILL